MANEEQLENEVKEEKVNEEATQQEAEAATETEEVKEEVKEETSVEDQVAEAKDKYLRLYSEFENFRRRTAKERLDLMKTANQDLILALLPVLDDFDRAVKSFETAEDLEAVKEGVNLIYTKLFNNLKQKGLEPIDAKGETFDTEIHEAVTQFPGDEENKGKVIDEVEKGYKLGEKVIRFSKVVVGA